MTEDGFIKFCKQNKPERIEATPFGHTIFFENGESVSVHATYDGIDYRHSSEPIPDSSQLIPDLMSISEDFTKGLKEKYSEPIPIDFFTNPHT